ncbi:MAG: hypothetical protein ACRDVM_08670, partial [Acidimicrobiia bacterium]
LRLLDGSSPSQASILGDGIVTLSEYRQAADAAVSCLVLPGLEAMATLDEESGLMVIETEASPDQLDRCLTELFHLVEEVWRLQTQPAP